MGLIPGPAGLAINTCFLAVAFIMFTIACSPAIYTLQGNQAAAPSNNTRSPSPAPTRLPTVVNQTYSPTVPAPNTTSPTTATPTTTAPTTRAPTTANITASPTTSAPTSNGTATPATGAPTSNGTVAPATHAPVPGNGTFSPTISVAPSYVGYMNPWVAGALTIGDTTGSQIFASTVFWTDISTTSVCNPVTPIFQQWSGPFGLCTNVTNTNKGVVYTKYVYAGLPQEVQAQQAMITLSAMFAAILLALRIFIVFFHHVELKAATFFLAVWWMCFAASSFSIWKTGHMASTYQTSAGFPLPTWVYDLAPAPYLAPSLPVSLGIAPGFQLMVAGFAFSVFVLVALALEGFDGEEEPKAPAKKPADVETPAAAAAGPSTAAGTPPVVNVGAAPVNTVNTV